MISGVEHSSIVASIASSSLAAGITQMQLILNLYIIDRREVQIGENTPRPHPICGNVQHRMQSGIYKSFLTEETLLKINFVSLKYSTSCCLC